MANPSLQIGNSNWAIKEDDLLGYSTVGTNYLPKPMTMTRESAGTRVNPQGLVETVELLGSELVDDGNFPLPNTEWDLTGEAEVTALGGRIYSSSGGVSSLDQSIGMVVGNKYKITLDVIATNGTKLSNPNGTNIYDTSTVGSKVFYITAAYSTLYFKRYSGITDVTITNISVKESTKNNLARVDYDGTASSLLVEPMRTNFVVTSASGNYGNPPASEINTTAPDGTNTAIRPVPDSASDRYQETIAGGTYSSGDEVTYSWYRKRFSTPVVDSYVGDLDIQVLVNATQVGVATEIISEVNGFNRVSATFSITDGSIDSILRFYFGSIIGDGNSSVAYWGHQLEVGSYATSYIPNFGTAAGVTRVQDQYSKTGISNLINSEEGVLFLEASTFENGADCRITLSDGTITNRVSIEWDILANTIKGFVGSDGNLVSPATYNQTDSNKIALKYKVNDCALWINGTEVSTDFSVSSLSGVNQLEFSNYGGTVPFEGKVKQLQVFKTALTDPELIALTT